MKRSLLHIGIVLLAFVTGLVAAGLWKFRSRANQNPQKIAPAADEQEWPLTKELVSRSLQTHSFRTDKLRRNSNDDIVWRWLKESISSYPQNWVKLDISDRESYGVVLYPPTLLEPADVSYYNQQLGETGLPPLEIGKRYLPVNVYQGDIICPSWSGLIEVEDSKLVYFAGSSA